MAHPARNACRKAILSSARVFFATTKTSMARRLLQSERNAMLLIDVLRLNVAAGKFQLHDLVIMPDHLHLLMTLPGDMTIEKAMQLIKGGFSYRLSREFGYQAEVWQRGFSEVRISDGQSFFRASRIYRSEPCQSRTRRYCRAEPLRLHLPGKEKSAGAKALILVAPKRPD